MPHRTTKYVHLLQSGSEVYAQSEGRKGRREMIALYDRCDTAEGYKGAYLVPAANADVAPNHITFVFMGFQSEAHAKRFAHDEARRLTDKGFTITITPNGPNVQDEWEKYLRRSTPTN